MKRILTLLALLAVGLAGFAEGPWKTNLLVNGCAELGNNDGWTKTSNGGSGWLIGGGYGDLVPCYSFNTSYSMCSMYQDIDLVFQGFSEDELDGGCKVLLQGRAGTTAGKASGSGVMKMLVHLLDADKNTLETVTLVDASFGEAPGWNSYEQQATLPTGTRYVRYEIGGKDAMFWAGHFGPGFNNMSVYLCPQDDTFSFRVSNSPFTKGRLVVNGTEMNASEGTSLELVRGAKVSMNLIPDANCEFVRIDVRTISGVPVSIAGSDGKYSFVMPANEVVISPTFEKVEIPMLADGYYVIHNANMLKWFANQVNKGNNAINGKLMADIDMEGEHVTPIGVGTVVEHSTTTFSESGFAGVFDGQGHVISNLTIDAVVGEVIVGLFGNLSGTVKNLVIDNGKYEEMPQDGRYGMIAGVVQPSGVVEYCGVTNSSLTASSHISGAIAGANYGGTIRNCYAYGNTNNANERVGNMIGDNRNDSNDLFGNVVQCWCDKSVVGANAGNVTDCHPNADTLSIGNGSLAYYLGKENPAWRQTIGTDFAPLPSAESKTVYLAKCHKTFTNIPEAAAGHVFEETDHCYFCGATGCKQVNGIFQISTKEELLLFAEFVNTQNAYARAVLTNDIVFNDNLIDKLTINETYAATVNEGAQITTWTPIGTSSSPFNGYIDGQGFSIKGLYLDDAIANIGLVGYSKGGSIYNLTITDSYLKGKGSTGGFIGYSDSPYIVTIENCYSERSYIVGTASSTGGFVGKTASGVCIRHCYNKSTVYSTSTDVGGFVGFGPATFYTCYNQGSVHGSDDAGGFVGECGNANFYNSYNSGEITCASSYVGGFVAYRKAGATHTFSHCYSTQVPANKYTYSGVFQKSEEEFASGEVCFFLNDERQGGDVWHQKIGTDAFPHFNDSDDNYVYKEANAYTNSLPDMFVFGGGRGKAGNPFLIKTRADLEKLATNVNNGFAYDRYYFLVANDIDLTTEPWTPIGHFSSSSIKPFSGSFDGGNHVIKNLTIVPEQEGTCGLFGLVINSDLKNIILDSVSITRPQAGHSYAGALTGRANYTDITACEVRSGMLSFGKDSQDGGLVGAYQGGTIQSCVNRASIKSSTNTCEYIGGIVGNAGIGDDWRGFSSLSTDNSVQILDCKNYGDITAAGGLVGGIAGCFYATIGNCHIDRCANAGTITGGDFTGGIAGRIEGFAYVDHNVNIGDIQDYYKSSSYSHYGGIVGGAYDPTERIRYNLNAGRVVVSATLVGGIVGAEGDNPNSSVVPSESDDPNCLGTEIKNNINVGEVSSPSSNSGAIVGKLFQSTAAKNAVTNSQNKEEWCIGSLDDKASASKGFIALTSSEMTGLLLVGSSQLGNQNQYFHFEEGKYPVPVGIEMSDIVRVAATPVNINESEMYNTVGTYSSSFQYDEAVSFSSAKSIVTFDKGTASYNTIAGADTIYISYGDACRKAVVVVAWNKNRKLLVETASDIAAIATGVNSGSSFSYKGVTLPKNAAGCYFLQKNDINRGTHTPIGTNANSFQGTYDGNGYKISGLVCNVSNRGGLFGVADNGAVIKNLGIAGSVTAANTSAGFVGDARQGSLTIEKCYNEVNVTLTSTTQSGGGAFVGNAENANVTIRNCYNMAAISSSADGYVCAIANKPDNASGKLEIENVHNYGAISGVLRTGGNAFAINATSISNCYMNTTKTSLNSIVDGVTRSPESDFNNGKICWLLNKQPYSRSDCESGLFTQNLDNSTGELWPVFNSKVVYPNGQDAFTNIRPDGEFTMTEYITYDKTNSPVDTVFDPTNLLLFAPENAEWTYSPAEYFTIDSLKNGHVYVTSKTDEEHAGWSGSEIITYQTSMQNVDGSITTVEVPIKYEKRYISPDASTNLKVTLKSLRTAGSPNDLFRFEALVIGRKDGYSWSIVNKETGLEYTNVSLSQTTLGQDIKIPDEGTYTLTFTATSTDDELGVRSFPASIDLRVYGVKNRIPQLCYGESITLTASDDVDFYMWSNGATTQSITVNPLSTQKYSVQMTKDLSTFTDSVTVVVSVPVAVTPNASIHVGDEIELKANGSYETYSWSNGENTPNITVSQAGTYVVETTDALGCASTASTTVSVYCITTTDLQKCHNESITLEAAASMDSVVWSDDARTTAFSLMIDKLQQTQQVRLVSYKDGKAYTDEVTVTVGVPVALNEVKAICEGTSTSIEPTENYETYSWDNGEGTKEISSEKRIVVETANTYRITATDQYGCVSSASVDLQIVPNPKVNLGEDKTICYGDTLLLDAGSGMARYEWSATRDFATAETAQTFIADTILLHTVQGLNNTRTVSVQVYDDYGCTNSDEIILTFKARPTVALSEGGLYCGEKNSLAPTFTLAGTAPFRLTYTDGKESATIDTDDQQFTPAAPGLGTYTYQALSLDDAFCSADATGQQSAVVVSELPSIDLGNDTTLCYGEKFILDAGKASSFEWRADNALVGKTQALLVDTTLVFGYWPINYDKQIVATITNEHGCKNSDTIQVSFKQRPTATVKGSNLFCGTDNVQAPTFVFTGIAPFTFIYNDGEESFTETVSDNEFRPTAPTEEGTYTYRMTSLGDGKCALSQYSLATTLTIAPIPSVDLGDDVALCKGEIAYLEAKTEEGNKCVWSRQSKKFPVSTESSLLIDETDVVSVVVSSPQGCKAYDTVAVAVKKPFAEQLGIVTFSKNGEDMVIAWEKTVDVGTVGYLVERETNFTNHWEAVSDTVFFNQPAVVVDYAANAAQRAYKYRLKTIDECGNFAASKSHRSMHLSITKQIDDKPSLAWNAYEPMDMVSQYLVLRGKNTAEMDTVDRIPASNASGETWDETESFEGKMYYKVLFVLDNPVDEKRYRDAAGNIVEGASIKAESGPFTLAISNIAEAENDETVTPNAVAEFANEVKVWPAGHAIFVECTAASDILLYDIQGQTLNSAKAAVAARFPVSTDGVYVVKVGGESYSVMVQK